MPSEPAPHSDINADFNAAAPALPAATRARLGQELLALLGKGRAGAGDAAVMKDLLARGASVQEKNAHGQTALMVAIHYEHTEMAGKILDAGARVHAKDHQDNTALVWCGYKGHSGIALRLLRAGARIDDCNSLGRSVLTQAAAKGHDDFLRALIAAGVDANHIDKRGETPLTAAAAAHQVTTVKTLIDAGADPEKPDRSGRTAAAIAQEKNLPRLAAAIEGEIRRKKKKAFADDLRQITEGARGDITLAAPLRLRRRGGG